MSELEAIKKKFVMEFNKKMGPKLVSGVSGKDEGRIKAVARKLVADTNVILGTSFEIEIYGINLDKNEMIYDIR